MGYGHCDAAHYGASNPRIQNFVITELVFQTDLQTLINAWPDLPKEVKVGIMTMIKAVKG